MPVRMMSTVATVIGVFAISTGAQNPPAVRQLGRLDRVSTDSLASVASALPLPGGRVLVNDAKGRRLLVFDSTLAHATIVADTTSVTSNGYGSGSGTLIRFRADTALFISPYSLSMFVIGPAATVVRVMAIPRPDDAQALLGIFGIPGFDARGRLLYFRGLGSLPGMLMLGRGSPPPQMTGLMAQMFPVGRTDSAAVVRVDLATRVLDTATSIKIPKSRREFKLDAQGMLQAIETTPDPLPLVDAWTVLPDGSLAVIRARDYHVDWLDADGRWSSTPKMPFDWQRVSDERKQTLIDSAVKAWQAGYDQVEASRRRGATRVGGGGGGSGGRGGGVGGGGGGPAVEIAPTTAIPPSLNDLPDYAPPFKQDAGPPPVHADADGNIWIRTTTMAKDQPVYDVVNRRGEIFDRVQLPSFRTIAGFGPGVIYMAVKDSAGIVRLERAKVK
jgi:hypothetical protein